MSSESQTEDNYEIVDLNAANNLMQEKAVKSIELRHYAHSNMNDSKHLTDNNITDDNLFDYNYY